MTILSRLNPLLAPFLSRLVVPGAPEIEILQPEETEAVKAPVFLNGMLDRITGTDEHSVLADHLQAASALTVTHAPVIRYTYRNALVRRSGFATARYSEKYSRGRDLAELVGPVVRLPHLRHCNNYVTWRYFGHWLVDGIPTAMIDPDDGPLWMPPHPDWAKWGHARDYQAALELPIVAAPVVHAESLSVYQDFGQGSHNACRYATIRNRLQARFGNGSADGYVYLRRGSTGVLRSIVNEEPFVDALVARDWTILDIASASMAEIQQAVCRAKVVMSIDGSQLCHAHLALLPRSVMVNLLPQDRFTSHLLGPCRAHAITPAIVVLQGSQDKGYQVDLEEALRTVDLAVAASDA
jgi:hypothetical protein